MALDNCISCPDACFGNTLDTDCVVYEGDRLTLVLESLLSQEQGNTQEIDDVITSDQVVSKSIVRDSNGACSGKITNRSFSYTMAPNVVGSVFSWDLRSFKNALPAGYSLGLVSVKASGNANIGSNLVADSSSVASSFSISSGQYPVTVRVEVRVTSPCGDIVLDKEIKIISPSKQGTFSTVLNARELNPSSGELILTDHLDKIEKQLSDIESYVETMPNPTSQLEDFDQRLGGLEGDDFDENEVVYTKDGGTTTSTLSAAISDLYTRITALETSISGNSIQIQSLQAQIDSINAS